MFIQKLGLKNFKCFKEVETNFSKISLLTGENSAGKSSLISGILMPFQSLNLIGSSFPCSISLNGKYINLGGFQEVSFNHDINQSIEVNLLLSVAYGNLSFETSWYYNKETKNVQLNYFDMSGTFLDIKVEQGLKNFIGGDYVTKYSFKKTSNPLMSELLENIEQSGKSSDQISWQPEKNQGLVQNDLFFNLENSTLCAEVQSNFNSLGSSRTSPMRTYYQSNENNKINQFGDGYIDQILKWNDENNVKLKQLVFLLKNLGIIYDIKPHKLSGGRFEIKVKVRKQSKWESLADVGFGVSQFMPIIVADLQLSDESTLIMCQPEIHLHPSVQASLGDYLVKQVNEKKKQYIVETHSEYLLNRIRLLIVKGEIQPEDVAVYYFENSIKEGSIAHRIEFTKDGQILNAPRGFFETYMIDTMDIALNA